MSKYVVERMTADALSDSAFSFETGEPVQLKSGSVHWAVILLDDDGEQTDDDFHFWPTRREAADSCRRLNAMLESEPTTTD